MRCFSQPSHRRRRWVLPALAFLALLATYACNKPNKPVAKVGSEWIGQPQWQVYLQSHPGENAPSALAGLIRREVAWEQARKLNLLQGQEWEEYRKRNRVSVLVKAHLAAQGGHGPLSATQAREMFMRRGEERQVLHVLCKTRLEAEAVLKRLQKGEDIRQLARALSKDPSAAGNSGDLGWIKREVVVQPFAEAVFSAKEGDLCGPFETEFGWHVAQVAARRGPTDADFAASRTRFMEEMQETADSMKRPGVLAPLQKQYPLTVDSAILALDRTTIAAPGDETRIAGRVAGATISLKDLKQFMGDYLKVAGQSHGLGPETKKRFMELLADDLRIVAAAEQAGLQKRPEVQASIWDSERQAALAALTKVHLGSFKVPEREMKAHYEKFPDRFRGIGAVRLYLLVTDLPENIDRATKEAMKGGDWGKLVDKYANKASTGTWDTGLVEVGKLSKLLPKEAIMAILKKPIDSLIGPVAGPEGIMLFKLRERHPGTVLAFADCQDAIRLDYLKEHGTRIVTEYLDHASVGIPIKRFPENANPPPTQ
jgi:hypothetical protein